MTGSKHDLSELTIDRDRPSPGSMRALRRNLFLAAAALVVVVGGWWWLRGPPGVPVTVATAQVSGGPGSRDVGITANGYVVARTQASVSSRISGRLEFLGVEEGSVVREGEVMARLENRDFQAAVTQAEAELLRAEAALREAQAGRERAAGDLARAQELYEKDFETRETMDHLTAELAAAVARVEVQEAQVGVAEAAVAVSRANLEYTLIRAPFDGTVLRKDAEVGEVVAPVATGGGLTRGAVVTMADLETLEVEVDVNEAYISRITDRQETRIVLDAYPDTGFAGEVRQIVPTADRQRATVQVKVSILEKDPRILTEMGARVEFIEEAGTQAGGGAPRISVPAEAVRDEGGRSVVWVVRDGRAFRTSIDAGPVSGGRRAVRSGLTGGEQVVMTSEGDLEDGGPVHVIAQ
jgi:RND family efflux transporter MFP subunit